MRVSIFAVACIVACLAHLPSAAAQSIRCEIPRAARDIWRCERGFVIGPENVIIRLPIPETDPEALYNAGVEAAGREDWRVAIAYFTAAHQRAHLVPRYMYNLGLAHARAGNEVPAIAWLAAYLTAQPDAANRAEVWAQITAMEARARTATSLAWDRAEAAVAAFPADQRWGGFGNGYSGIAQSAARAQDWTRVRGIVERHVRSNASVFALHPGWSTDEWIAFFLFRVDDGLAGAIEDGDLAAAQALAAEKGSRLSDRERGQIESLRDLSLITALGRQEYAPEFMVRRNLGCNDAAPEGDVNCSIWSLARSADVARLRTAAGIALSRASEGSLRRWEAMAALGRSGEALSYITGLEPVGFGGLARERNAASVGEILLLAGDLQNAQRALRISEGYAAGNTNLPGYNGAQHLSALLLAEAGQMESAIQLLAIEYTRSMEPSTLAVSWPQIRFDAPALLAEFLLNRGRIDESILLSTQSDSLRRVYFVEEVRARLRDGRLGAQLDVEASHRAAVAAASDGSPPAEARRRAIENAIIHALTIPPASYDVTRWLERARRVDNPYSQLARIREIAEGNARALRRTRALYERSGGIWGQ